MCCRKVFCLYVLMCHRVCLYVQYISTVQYSTVFNIPPSLSMNICRALLENILISNFTLHYLNVHSSKFGKSYFCYSKVGNSISNISNIYL